MNKDIMTKELLEKLARTVAPLSDAQLNDAQLNDAQLAAVAGGAGCRTPSCSNGVAVDSKD